MKEFAELIACIILVIAFMSCTLNRGFCVSINGQDSCIKFGTSNKESKP